MQADGTHSVAPSAPKEQKPKPEAIYWAEDRELPESIIDLHGNKSSEQG